jgi:NADH-quinone oxidoreductase subunit G
MAIDGGSMLDAEPHLAGTAKSDVICVAASTAAAQGLADATRASVTGPAGTVTLPLHVLPDSEMVADTVWLPGRVDGVQITAKLGATVGQRVAVRRSEAMSFAGSDDSEGAGR